MAEQGAEATEQKSVSTQETKRRGGKPPDLFCLSSANPALLIRRGTWTICMERQTDTVSKGIFGNLDRFFKKGSTYDTLEADHLNILLGAFFQGRRGTGRGEMTL